MRTLRRSPGRRDGVAISSLETLGVPVEGGPLYQTALTHRSYAFEQEIDAHNERLELLGDAILDAVVTDHIFREFPDLSEGDMARLRASVVNTAALADLARAVGLGDHLLLGKGEESSGGRAKESLLADAFEAVVGAVYLDQGFDAVRHKVLPLFAEALDSVIAEGGPDDAKSELQELVMKERGVLPSYSVKAEGPDHAKRFIASVSIAGVVAASGQGRTKKAAEQVAARAALQGLQEERADARAS